MKAIRARVQQTAPVPPRRIASAWPLPASWAGPAITAALAVVAYVVGGWR